jgi:zinc transport system substrate-binding protein
MQSRFLVIGLVGLLMATPLLLCSCQSDAPEAHDGPVRVFVSIQPQKTFVQAIGGEHVSVDVLVRPGQSPATYEPTAKQLVALGEADVYFTIGVPFEKTLMAKIQRMFPYLNVVNTIEGIALRAMDDGHHHHDHEAGGHDHGGSDPHTWLDPKLVAVQARHIADALKQIDPSHAEAYEQNFRQVTARLNQLDSELAEILKPCKGRRLYVFHPAFGYLADAYGLHQVAIEVEGKSPTGRALTATIEQAKQDGANVIFVQPEFSQQAAKKIAQAIDGQVLPLDPLAADYFRNMRQMARTIAQALSAQ